MRLQSQNPLTSIYLQGAVSWGIRINQRLSIGLISVNQVIETWHTSELQTYPHKNNAGLGLFSASTVKSIHIEEYCVTSIAGKSLWIFPGEMAYQNETQNQARCLLVAHNLPYFTTTQDGIFWFLQHATVTPPPLPALPPTSWSPYDSLT